MQLNSVKPDFETVCYAKAILAGEHVVLSGHPAIIMPVKSKSFHLQYIATPEKLSANFSGQYQNILSVIFWQAIHRAMELLALDHHDFRGYFNIESNIPIGAGLGASGALCVAIGKWFVFNKLISEANLLDFSRQIEHMFHGQSSGADIAVSIVGEPIRFSSASGIQNVVPTWQPKLYLSYTGKTASTVDCIETVNALKQRDPELASMIEKDMVQAALEIETALQSPAELGLSKLTAGILRACSCFKRWGLAEGAVTEHLNLLNDHGALAAKPTGSGGGGYILSLWDQQPPKHLQEQMIVLQ